jgi:hypothetical protein
VLLAAGLTLASGTTLAPAAHAAQFQITGITLGGHLPTAAHGTVSGTALGAPAAASAHFPAVVSLTSVSPAAPKATDKLTLTGTVTNSGSTPITSMHVGMWANQNPLGDRSAIAAVAGTGTPQSDDPSELNAPQADLGTLAPGATSAPFTLVVDIAALGLTTDHVYEIAVDAQGSVSGSDVRPLGVARTYLPLYSGAGGAKPTRIATLWPVVEPPRVQPQTYTDTDQADQAVLTDDSLASDLGADGRLGQIQSIGAGLGAAGLKPTWVIDPDLISSVLRMESKYQVANGDDSQGASPGCKCTKPGLGSDAAKTWRTAMQGALTGLDAQQVLSLPAADPDLASIAHNAPSSSTLKQAVGIANTDLGQVGLNPLQVNASHSVAWPYQGYLDTSVVALAHGIGDTQVIANGAGLPNSPGLNYTPNAARSIGGGMTAVAADPTLSAIFSGDLSTPGAQTLAEQRFLAETLAITLEQPGIQRSILVQPPRDMSASTAHTLATALTDAMKPGTWATPASYASVAQAAPTKGAGSTVPAPSGYPAEARKNELTPDALSAVSGTQAKLAQLELILANPAPTRSAFSSAILRSVSTQWRDQSTLGANYQANTSAYLTSLHGKVAILPKPGNAITLSGSGSATIPITIENDLPQSVINLEAELSSGTPQRLSVSDATPEYAYKAVATGGNTKPSLKFPVKAFANGQVVMTAQLYTTADQEPYGDPITFTVDITQLPSGVIAVLAGGGLLVLLAGLRLYWKRKKNAAGDGQAGETGGDDGDRDDEDGGGRDDGDRGDEDDGDAPEAENADDPAPDTASVAAAPASPAAARGKRTRGVEKNTP